MARAIVTTLLVFLIASPMEVAGAQTLAPSVARADLKPSAFTPGAVSFERRARSSRQAAPQGRRDSLWNGTLVGAGLGAILGTLGGVAVLGCSECAGFNVPLTFGVLGAGAGAAIGAGIDAARHNRSSARPPRPLRRVGVAPVLRDRTRALVAVVQF